MFVAFGTSAFSIICQIILGVFKTNISYFPSFREIIGKKIILNFNKLFGWQIFNRIVQLWQNIHQKDFPNFLNQILIYWILTSFSSNTHRNQSNYNLSFLDSHKIYSHRFFNHFSLNTKRFFSSIHSGFFLIYMLL